MSRPERERRGRERRARGDRGESRAEEFLRGRGYRVLERNFRTRQGELDVVALEGKTVCFIEVKTVSGGDAGVGGERVERGQRRRMALAALEYLAAHDLEECAARFDLVTVTGPDENPAIELHRDVFSAEEVLEEPYA